MRNSLPTLLLLALMAVLARGLSAQIDPFAPGPPEKTPEQENLEELLTGCWNLMAYNSPSNQIDPNSITCFLTFQDGFSSIWWSATTRRPDTFADLVETPVVQAEIRRYRVSEFLKLQMVASQRFDNLSGELVVNGPREPLEYDLTIDSGSDEMTLLRVDGTRMIFRRVESKGFPRSALTRLGVNDPLDVKEPKKEEPDEKETPKKKGTDSTGDAELDALLAKIGQEDETEEEKLVKRLLGCWTLKDYVGRDTSIAPKSVQAFLTFQDGFSTIWWSARKFETSYLGSQEEAQLVQSEVRRFRISEFGDLQMAPLHTVENLAGPLALNARRQPIEYTLEFDEETKELILSRGDGSRMTFAKSAALRFPQAAIDRLTETRGGRVEVLPGAIPRRR